MKEQGSTVHKKSAFVKNLTAIIIIFLIISGGIALAYVTSGNTTKTAKEQYFTAEKESIDLYIDTFKNRYQTELDWLNYAQENATETALDFSLKYDARFVNDDFGMGLNFNDILDNTRLTLKTQRDVKAKELATGLELNLSGLKVDDFDFHLTDDAIMLGLPFLDEVLKYSFEDLGMLLGEEEPALTEEDVKRFSDIFFNQNGGLLTEADKIYFKKEYAKLFYDSISEDAFTTTEDTIDVHGQSIESEKIVLHLDEEALIDIFVTMLDRLESEDKIQEILERQLASIVLTETDWNNFTTEFEDGVKMLKEGVKGLHIPDGLTSTLWLDNDHIIQRDFEMTMGPNPNDLITFSVYGEQLFEKEQQIFNYTFAVEDEIDESAMTISGDLFWDGKELNDTVKLDAEEANIAYTARETVDKKNREFNREFAVTDAYNDTFVLLWSGDSAYEKDEMASEHILSIDDPYNDETIGLQVDINSKRIKNVDMPTDNIKDLGDMSETELMDYFDNKVADRFEQWLVKLIGFPGRF